MHSRPMTSLLLSCALLLAAAPIAASDPESPPEPVRPEFGGLSSPIRPGSSIGGCTANFVFYDERYPTPEDPEPDVAVYIGTAAHCTSGVDQRITMTGVGEFGTVAYDSDQHGSNVDFSLIQIDAHRVGQTNPTVRSWGGPAGSITTSQLARGDRVNVYGYGLVVGSFEQTRPRFGFLVNWNDNEYVADMPAVNGDSGAPLLHDETGYALGIISRYGFTATPPSTDVGPMMPWIFRELDKAGFDVLLAHAEG